ncbi:Mur ligase family protein [Candidatus Margulisiibacteriota bacterium]
MKKIAILGEDGITGKAVTSYINSNNEYTLIKPEEADIIITSPGIPLEESQKKYQKPIISEIEFASWNVFVPYVAVTGTNGKSTTTALIAHILGVPPCGNIGTSFIETVQKHGNKIPYYIIEVSSYQLEAIQTFQPKVAIILNITEDHLKRHGTVENYAWTKANVFKNQTKEDFVIYNQDDNNIAPIIKEAKSTLVPFSVKGLIEQNFTAARLTCEKLGIPKDTIEEKIKTFQNLEHRLEKVTTTKNNITIINDSKSTNFNSLQAALESLEGSIVLLVGGQDKGGDMSEELQNLLSKKVIKVISYGDALERFNTLFPNIIGSIYKFEDAIKLVLENTPKNTTLLLSPGCASFDQHKNFEERGEIFKDTIKKLIKS